MRCVLADSGIHVRPNGDITMCCDQSSLGLNAKDVSLQQAYTSPQFKRVRDNITKGIKDSSCNICWLLKSKNNRYGRRFWMPSWTPKWNMLAPGGYKRGALI